MKQKSYGFLLLVLLGVVQSMGYAQNINLDKYTGQLQSLTKIRIASASILPKKWDKEHNWQLIEEAVKRAAQEGKAQVVVTPEGVLEGYVINEVNNEKDAEKKNELIKKFENLGESLSGDYIRKACALSDELNIFLVMGFLEKREDHLFNTVILIDPDGDIIGRYSKTHFAQGYSINPKLYRTGDEYPVFDTPFGKVGILICYDRQLPEPARILALEGAQVLFLPSYGSYTDRDGWNTILLRTRAYENRYPLVFSHPHQSLIIDSHGEIKAMGQESEIVYYEIDTSPDNIANRFSNRRPSTYTEIIKGNDPAH
jgi:predicted amidohydrolase